MAADSVAYEYDLNGRLKKLTFANSDEVEVAYDDMGNRESVETTIATPFAPLVSPPEESEPKSE